MKISELVAQLTELQTQIGDREVLITDGFDARCYRGAYAVQVFEDFDGQCYADIGLGGLQEE